MGNPRENNSCEPLFCSLAEMAAAERIARGSWLKECVMYGEIKAEKVRSAGRRGFKYVVPVRSAELQDKILKYRAAEAAEKEEAQKKKREFREQQLGKKLERKALSLEVRLNACGRIDEDDTPILCTIAEIASADEKINARELKQIIEHGALQAKRMKSPGREGFAYAVAVSNPEIKRKVMQIREDRKCRLRAKASKRREKTRRRLENRVMEVQRRLCESNNGRPPMLCTIAEIASTDGTMSVRWLKYAIEEGVLQAERMKSAVPQGFAYILRVSNKEIQDRVITLRSKKTKRTRQQELAGRN